MEIIKIDMKADDNKIAKGIFWKSLERFGVLGTQFFLRIILARLLAPEHYGLLALMMVFITIANVFVQSGLNTALIQNKDVTEEDYSSVLWVSLGIAGFIYCLIFLTAPAIASVYKMRDIVKPLRVLSLMLFPGALNSIQLAKVSREMDFKKVFYSNLIGSILSGVIGIMVAYNGGGVWALVAQSLLNFCIVCVVMKFTVKMKIRLKCNWTRVKVLFSFGWKLAVSSFLNAIAEDIRSLVIGIKYDADILGNYNQGMQFPQYGINIIQSSISSVILPAMSERQSDKERVKQVMKNTIKLSTYIVFPIMAGMAAISHSFVNIVLTEKWLGCVPYMRLYCLIFSFYPVYTCNLQAINAMGRSDLYLKLEIIKQIYNILLLAIAVFCFRTPFSIALSAAAAIPINLLLNTFYNKELVMYSLSEQIIDFLPSMLTSIVMFTLCYSIEFLGFSSIITICLQVIVGVSFYVFCSLWLKNPLFKKVLSVLKVLMGRR